MYPQETRGLEMPKDVTIMALLADQVNTIDRLEGKIYGTVSVGVEEARVSPSSILYRMKDIIVDNNIRLAKLLDHMEVVH